MTRLSNPGLVAARGLILAATLGLNCLSGFAAAPLTQIRDVLELPPEALAAKPPVHLHAVVTCVDKSYKMTFVHDSDAGIFLFGHTPRLVLAPGDVLEIRAVAKSGLFSPMLDSAEIALTGKTNLPAPRLVPLPGIVSGALVGERVETEGVVQRVSTSDDHLWLSLVAGESRCTISAPAPDSGNRADLLDARVRVRGVVAATFNSQRQLTGFQVYVNGPADIETIAPSPGDPFQMPLCPIAELTHYAGRRVGEHRVHVQGVVTLHWPGRGTVLQDSTGGVLIENGLAGSVKVGDAVDAAGFLSPIGMDNRLRNAESRPAQGASPPAALPGLSAEASSGDNLLVRMTARVIEWQLVRDGEATALLSASNRLFAAVLPTADPPRVAGAFPSGSLVSVVGVMKALAPETRGVTHAALWLRDPSDIALLQSPAASPWKWVLISAGVTVCVAFGSMATVALLLVRQRGERDRMSAQQHEAKQRFNELERQLRYSHRDREHIAQELHDNIIQSIYSVGLGIDEARRLAQKAPERVEERLDVAIQSLNGIIRDVRAFLAGLESKSLEGHELKTALKSVLLASGEDQQNRFSFQIDASAARELTSLQATEVFNIAKEAMSNAMRHAQARFTTVSLMSRGHGVRLEVADDGAGFDPGQVNGSSLGLRNVRSRARTIGAQLEILSAPGKGARIIVDIPT